MAPLERGAVSVGKNFLEEHLRWLRLDAERVNNVVDSRGDGVQSSGWHGVERVKELCLRRRHCAAEQGAAGRRQGQLGAAGVVVGPVTPNEPTVHETRNDHRNRALVRERAIRQLVHGKRGRLGEALKHEQLRRAQLPPLLGAAMRLMQRTDDSSESVDDLGNVVSMFV